MAGGLQSKGAYSCKMVAELGNDSYSTIWPRGNLEMAGGLPSKGIYSCKII